MPALSWTELEFRDVAWRENQLCAKAVAAGVGDWLCPVYFDCPLLWPLHLGEKKTLNFCNWEAK